MAEIQIEMESRFDDRGPGRPRSTQGAAKTRAFASRIYSTISDCWTLTKPEVNFLIALATFTGFYLGHTRRSVYFPFALLTCTLIGTILVASGTATLNQYVERRFDAQMR